ncbi:hypothetical protein M9H77_12163 [Catharanthus roseus]|uniref:Uncharacterized protein n=1 Tax=Catharanthus roseus TaxID=4058 RepID=A0ACC0BGQ0_CATRO|nr:hypothetical protein M9H77_12163 [Catharanthus roseus]
MAEWQKPLEGVLKINIDGAWRIWWMYSSGKELEGDFVRAMAGLMHRGAGPKHKEAKALLTGFELAARLGTEVFMVESDSTVIVSRYNENGVNLSPVGNIVAEVKWRIT